MNLYLCPNCKTNRTRFNLIEQVVTYVKIDPLTGDVVQSADTPQDALQLHYNGPSQRIQCGVCGLIEEEQQFASYAKSHPLHK
ncbi:MAG: DNA alkylation repair protein [Bacilli bacterium]